MNTSYTLHSIICCTLLFTLSICPLSAQQLPQYTSISINPYLINPALAGTEDFIHLQAGYRSQWTNFEDAPITAYFSGHANLSKPPKNKNVPKLANKSRISVGLNLLNDQTGPLNQSHAAASFAYNFALNAKGWRLSMALDGGIRGFTYNPSGYTDDLLHQDDAILLGPINKNLLNLAAGFWLYNDRYFAGVSSFQLYNTDGIGDNSDIIPNSAFLRHFYYMAGFKTDLGLNTYLVPSFLLKSVAGAPLSYEINTKLVIDERYWLGGNYRKEDSFAVFGGLLIKDRLELTYAYDLTLSKIRYASAGSHEIHLGYRIFHRDGVVCPGRFW